MEKYAVVRTVGQGSFGKVYLVKHKRERKLYCMKTIRLEGIPEAERRACQTEVKLMTTMQHPNIVGFKESFSARQGKILCIVMTYCDGGDLAERLKKNGSRLFKEDQILHWFVQIALGLHFMHDMHEKTVLHRDLKTQNIFLLGNGRLVIGDLGISKVLDSDTDFTKTTIGTPYYMSPEVYKSKPYNHKSDVWALGCVLYEMITLKHAFNAKSLNGLMGKVVKGNFDPISPRYSKHLAQLVGAMLATDPDRRPSLPQILSLPFIKTHVYTFLNQIVERPRNEIGDGTMVLRRAAGGLQGVATMESIIDKMQLQQIENLRKQLRVLGIQDVVGQAEAPVPAPAPAPAPPPPAPIRQAQRVSSENNNGAESNRAPVRQSESRQIQKEQRSALMLERERKRAVETALDKLRKERLLRANERMARVERQRKREDIEKRRGTQQQLTAEERRRSDRSPRSPVGNPAPSSNADRWKSNNPIYIANRKAAEFERRSQQREASPQVTNAVPMHGNESPPPPPPPPPPIASVSKVGDRRREAWDAPSEPRLQQDRMRDMRINSDKSHDSGSDNPRSAARAAARPPPVNARKPSRESFDDTSSVSSDSDDSSSILANDTDDDDIADKEAELIAELKDATVRCSTIQNALRQIKSANAQRMISEQSTEDDRESDDDSSCSDSDSDVKPSPRQPQQSTSSTSSVATGRSSDSQPSRESKTRWANRPSNIECNRPPNVRANRLQAVADDSGSDSSSDNDLFSPMPREAPSTFAIKGGGGLKQRIAILEEECIRALGRKRYQQVYQLSKSSLNSKLYEAGSGKRSPGGSSSEKSIQRQIEQLLSPDGKLEYAKKIDTLIFMQETV